MSDHAGPSGSTAEPSTSVGTESAPTSTASAGGYRPQERFSFPAAAQPEIVRAYQKDTYYKDLFTSQVSDVVRSLFGTRVQHAHTSAISLVGALGYYVLSTSSIPGTGDGRGGQTLGEEYVNSIPSDARTGRIITRAKRLSWILLHVLGPYALTKLYAALRRYALRAKADLDAQEARARARAKALDQHYTPKVGLHRRLVNWLARVLPALETLQSQDGWLAYLSAAHLMLFYLGGKFYSAAQRLTGVTYISTIPKRPGYQPPSYEVLGVLLGIQLFVKLMLEVRSYRRSKRQAVDDGEEKSSGVDPATTVEIDTAVFSHASQPAKRVTQQDNAESIDLLYAHLPDDEEETDQDAVARINTSAAQANASSTLQCTLCMDTRAPHRATSAVTECGHCFDWACIVAWIAEKVSPHPPRPSPKQLQLLTNASS
ncbi:pex2 / Pex12 amino terminal region family protein [Moesziomyces antarcticus]|uniref:RING-type E3 ubiquitin transferase n=1 Tax=Pseudozyma antarctica TaxID=84753 RepID=A0A081CCP7_PSEA2|nr:pex2 / Pex12 amino terminal region family protein [Moesziomyces antarcticus]GAK64443.1 pex2 / Pex12 amino terminal region family protein [Moesziomyces antarcticus]